MPEFVMSDLTDRHEEALYERISQIIEAARSHVSRTVNTAMVHAYWLIGRDVVEVELESALIDTRQKAYEQILAGNLWVYRRRRFGKNIGVQFVSIRPTGAW